MPLFACVLMGVHLSEEGDTIRLPKGSVPPQTFRASVLRMAEGVVLMHTVRRRGHSRRSKRRAGRKSRAR